MLHRDSDIELDHLLAQFISRAASLCFDGALKGGSHTVSDGSCADHFSGEGLPCRARPLTRAGHLLTDCISFLWMNKTDGAWIRTSRRFLRSSSPADCSVGGAAGEIWKALRYWQLGRCPMVCWTTELTGTRLLRLACRGRSLAVDLAARGNVQMGFMLLVMVSAYLRPSEPVNLRWGHLLLPIRNVAANHSR